MDSNAWQISAPGIPAKAFSALGFEKLKIEKRSQGIDTATFSAKGAPFDSAFFAAWGTVCTITKNGKPWFTGRLTKPTPQGTGKTESIEYELSGPWWDLDNCTYQQQGSFYNGNESSPASLLALTPLIYLGYECPADGGTFGRLLTGQQIANILSFAISCGANLRIGNIDPGIIFPCSKQKAATCARLIIEILQWVPDQTFSFDYSTTPPTANVTRRANSRQVAYSIQGTPADSLKLVPRNDLQVPCVGLFYIFGSNAGGSKWNTQSSDIYPPDSNVAQLRALVAPLELGGGSIITQKQPVETFAIPQDDEDGNGGLDMVQWFARKCTSLQGLTLSNIHVVQNSWYSLLDNNGTDDGGYTIPQKDSNGNPLTDFPDDGLSVLPNELISGSIPPWLCAPKGTGQTTPTDGYIHAAKITVTVRLKYTGDESDPNYDYSTWINNDPDGQQFYVDLVCTDAVTQVYQKPLSETNAEQPPTGMAEYLYNALAPLHQEGEFSTKEQECSGELQVGMGLNLTGGRPEWVAMNAQIQSVTEDIDTGMTTAKVGPPKHLGPAELLALIRSWRNISGVSEGFDSRSTGANDNSTSGSDGLGAGPAVNTAAPPPTMPPPAYTVKDASNGATAKCIVTPGNHLDSTNGTTWIPTIGGVAINASTPPTLVPSSGATVVFFKLTVNALDGSGATQAGQITAIEIDSAASMPASNNTTQYQLCANITVTTGAKAFVTSGGGGVSGSQTTAPCGATLQFGLQ